MLPSVVPPSLNVTVPVVAPLLPKATGLTVAVNVTGCPKSDAFINPNASADASTKIWSAPDTIVKRWLAASYGASRLSVTADGAVASVTRLYAAAPPSPLAFAITHRFDVPYSTIIARLLAASYAAGLSTKPLGDPAAPSGIRLIQCGVPPKPLALVSAHTALVGVPV